jgi:hypothetical protein
MTTLIADQYGPLEGEPRWNALTLSVTARIACREAVQLRAVIDSVGRQLLLPATLRRLRARIEFFRNVRGQKKPSGRTGGFDDTSCEGLRSARHLPGSHRKGDISYALPAGREVGAATTPPLRTLVSKTAN